MTTNGPAWYSGEMQIAKNEDWRVNLQYQQTITFVLPDEDVVSGGSPITTEIRSLDLTGSTFLMQIRKEPADKTAIVTLSSGDGIVLTDALDGRVEITILRSKLKRLQAGAYVADLVRTDANGYAERMWEGVCTVVEGVSR
jgi:hypothetical protein